MSEGKVISFDKLKKKKAPTKREPSKYDFKHGEREFLFHADSCPQGLVLTYCVQFKVVFDAPDFIKKSMEETGMLDRISQQPVRTKHVHLGGWLFWVPFRWRVRYAIAQMKEDILETCAAIDRFDKIAEGIENL